MARTKKQTPQRLFYDEFYAMTIEQQAIALMILAEHHEYVKKHRDDLVSADAPAALPGEAG